MPPPPAPAPPAPGPARAARPRPRPHGRGKSVTFCTRCERRPAPAAAPAPPDPDVRYYSDPGRPDDIPEGGKSEPTPIHPEQRYYSEPDVKYFEIDYVFLKELRKIARNNCPKCKRKARKTGPSKPKRTRRVSENCVLCDGRYHSELRHCPLCCEICNRSTDTLNSNDDEYSLVSRSCSLPSGKAATSRSKSTPTRRKNSIQSNKSVSFLESSSESMKDEPNYTAKSFTNDLKKFLLKPTPPRLSLRDKFLISFKQELEATRKSPKLKAIKGLWKSY